MEEKLMRLDAEAAFADCERLWQDGASRENIRRM